MVQIHCVEHQLPACKRPAGFACYACQPAPAVCCWVACTRWRCVGGCASLRLPVQACEADVRRLAQKARLCLPQTQWSAGISLQRPFAVQASVDSLRTNYVDPAMVGVTSLLCMGAWWETPDVRTFEFELPFQGEACLPGQYAAFRFDQVSCLQASSACVFGDQNKVALHLVPGGRRQSCAPLSSSCPFRARPACQGSMQPSDLTR